MPWWTHSDPLPTENSAPAFSSTLVATLDAYLGLQTGIPVESVDRYIENAWAEDPDLTLRVIWSTRSIHDGKGEKELFYRAFGWLFENHPRTAITNMHCLVDPVCLRSGKDTKRKKRRGASHGYWKDLLNILALATVDELRPKVPPPIRVPISCTITVIASLALPSSTTRNKRHGRALSGSNGPAELMTVLQKLLDKRYRALYVAAARLFAGQLAKEADIMNKITAMPASADKTDRMALMRALTLVSKWAPTPGGSHDRITDISSAICLLLHEAQLSFPITRNISLPVATSLLASEMHMLRCAYQKHILTRGRRYTCAPEPLMSSNRWSEIVYSRNKELFFTHDEERFLDYLQDISDATLFPHVLAIQAVRLHRQQRAYVGTTRSLAKALHERRRPLAEAGMRVVDIQWATLLARLRESGRLDNCIAVCDVSESMGSVRHSSPGKSPSDIDPIWPAISLSLLFVTIDPESKRVPLGATIDGMDKVKWGWNTNFNAVFLKLILPLAVQHNVPKDQMIKRIFVFSDMQFDEADARASTSRDAATEWKTNHDVIAEAYARAGYDVPELVYWNLCPTRETGMRQGVALLSGYSPSSLKLFLSIGEEEKWAATSYDGLVVVD
ncbi:protein of unknown function (DUF2828) domain containing protein [Tylopilus felleus]